MDTKCRFGLGCAVLLSAILSVEPAHADDGIMYYHGDPRLLKGNGQIRMVREFVRIKVGSKTAKVYCRFVFRNEGGPTVARVGFPDGCDHDGEEGGDPVKPSLESFRSCVDGRPVDIRIERTKEASNVPYSFFHEKQVEFSRHQTRIVEDWYQTNLDLNATSTPNYYIYGLTYIMQSGASWMGKIGRAEIVVDFGDNKLKRPKPVRVFAVADAINFRRWDRVPKNLVFWRGFARPTHSRNRLIFRRMRFKPNQDSDVELAFAPHTIKW